MKTKFIVAYRTKFTRTLRTTEVSAESRDDAWNKGFEFGEVLTVGKRIELAPVSPVQFPVAIRLLN